MQCLSECGAEIFSAEPHSVNVDHGTMRAVPPLPGCPRCGGLARPNILMFGDWGWDSSHAEAQQRRLKSWLASIAGGPARRRRVRRRDGDPHRASALARRSPAATTRTLIRINPRDPEVPDGQISLPMGAFEALWAIDERIGSWIPPTIAGA